MQQEVRNGGFPPQQNAQVGMPYPMAGATTYNQAQGGPPVYPQTPYSQYPAGNAGYGNSYPPGPCPPMVYPQAQYQQGGYPQNAGFEPSGYGYGSNRPQNTSIPMAAGLRGGMNSFDRDDQWDIPGDKVLDDSVDVMVRMGFIRKVYAILTCQLSITFGMALAFNLNRAAAQWLYANPWVLIVATLVTCASVCTMVCVPKVARTAPTNYMLLFVLSACFGLTLGYTTGAVSSSAFAMAAGMTAAVTLAVTLFACQTKWDFTGAGIYAFVLIIVLMLFGLVAAFVRNKVVQIVYASLGALIFSFYIIMDTQKIVGGKHRTYPFSIDDYAFAALALYMDILNLFLYILQLIAMTENN